MQDLSMDQWPESANIGEPWVDKFGRVRQPAVMYVADDGARTYGVEAMATFVETHVAHGAKVIQFPKRRTAAARQRERRSRAGRSSARSGDSGSDDSDSEPPAAERWRWASEASWRSFVASIRSRDFERELHLERMAGWSR
jgi:hypothetical protein